MGYFWAAMHALNYLFDVDSGIGQWFIPLLAGWVFAETSKRFAKFLGHSTLVVPWTVSILTAGVFAFSLNQSWDEVPLYLEVPLVAIACPMIYTVVRNILRVLPFKWSTYVYLALKGSTRPGGPNGHS